MRLQVFLSLTTKFHGMRQFIIEMLLLMFSGFACSCSCKKSEQVCVRTGLFGLYGCIDSKL